MQLKSAPKIIPKILSLFLVLATIFTILPQQAFAIDGFGPVNGSAATGGVSTPGGPTSGTTDGDWVEDRQGYRITVLDHAGAPAFTFNGKDSLDIIFTDKSKFDQMNYYVDGTKSDNGKGTIKGSKDAMNVAYFTFADLQYFFKHGTWGTLTPMGTNTPAGVAEKNSAIVKLTNLPYPFELKAIGYDSNKKPTGWRVQSFSGEARQKLFGISEKIEDNAGLYALLNTYKLTNEKIDWLWRPKAGAFFTNGTWTADDIASLKIEPGKVENGVTGKTPIQLIGSKKLFISVEPIIWNPLRISAKQWSYGVYGTQTGVARAIDWLAGGGWFVQSNSSLGGYDTKIFGKGGRQAFTLPTNIKANFPGWNFPDTGPRAYNWSMMPPTTAQLSTANNKDTMWLEHGIAIHLYHIGDATEIPQTHTWDIPIPTPQPAPDPTKIPKLPEEQVDKTRVFNIVKTYRDRTLDDDNNEVVTHVATFSRTNNPAIITIEDEPTYKVKEWFISETYNNPAKETTWEDNHNQAPTTGPTGTKPSLTEIKPKNTTLYVLLEKKIGDEVTNTAGPLVIEESQVTKAVETIKSDVTGWGPKTMTFSAADITQNNNISIQYDTPLIR